MQVGGGVSDRDTVLIIVLENAVWVTVEGFVEELVEGLSLLLVHIVELTTLETDDALVELEETKNEVDWFKVDVLVLIVEELVGELITELVVVLMTNPPQDWQQKVVKGTPSIANIGLHKLVLFPKFWK